MKYHMIQLKKIAKRWQNTLLLKKSVSQTTDTSVTEDLSMFDEQI